MTSRDYLLPPRRVARRDYLAPTRDYLAPSAAPSRPGAEPWRLPESGSRAPQPTSGGIEIVCRALQPGELRFREDSPAGPVLEGRLMPYGEFTEINSRNEGHFLERFAPGSLAKTLAAHLKRIRVLFEHGQDRSIGRQPIAVVDSFRDAPDGAYYRASLLRGVPELLVEGLRSGVYGSSVRFNPVKVDRVRFPRPSAVNPAGIEERTIREARIYEFSVVTFPAYQNATAQVVA